jgi:hypothetical protein
MAAILLSVEMDSCISSFKNQQLSVCCSRSDIEAKLYEIISASAFISLSHKPQTDIPATFLRYLAGKSPLLSETGTWTRKLLHTLTD